MSRRSGPYATVSSKGQITIPLRFRRALGWQWGDHLLFDVVDPKSGTFAVRRVSSTLSRAIRERRRARRTLADEEVVLLAMLDDPTAPDEALFALLRQIRQRVRKEGNTP